MRQLRIDIAGEYMIYPLSFMYTNLNEINLLTLPSVNVQYTHLDPFEFDVVAFLSQAKGINVLLIGIIIIILLIIICIGINFLINRKS